MGDPPPGEKNKRKIAKPSKGEAGKRRKDQEGLKDG